MNWVSNDKNPTSKDVDMSNGLTDVVMAALCLAGADIAGSEWERGLMVWLAEHDQAVRGRGWAFFDIDEMGWTRSDFPRQRHFVFRVLDRAIRQTGWEKLNYAPNVQRIVGRLEGIRRLVSEYPPPDAGGETSGRGADQRAAGFGRYPTHGIYLHAHGCLICNDR